jgi:hypothetical protein
MTCYRERDLCLSVLKETGKIERIVKGEKWGPHFGISLDFPVFFSLRDAND